MFCTPKKTTFWYPPLSEAKLSDMEPDMEQHDSPKAKMIRLWQAPEYEFITRRPTELTILDSNSSSSSISQLEKRKMGHPNQNIDRFSSLSGDIIHHIFSFLEPQAFVAMGMVSKIYRQLFMSSPYVNFSFMSKTISPLKRCSCQRFCYFLHNYFTIRERLGIKRLCLRWHCYNRSFASYSETLYLLMEFDVEELDIVFEADHYFHPMFDTPILEPRLSDYAHYRLLQLGHMPIVQPWFFNRRIFNYQMLKSLKLHQSPGNLFQFPSVSLDSLEVLSLSHLRILESNKFSLTEWISSCCPLLKKLHLEQVEGMREFHLESAVLEEFKLTILRYSTENFTELDISTEKLKSLYIYIQLYSDGFELVRIKAPCLQSLEWMGFAPRQCSFAPSTYLHSCVLDLKYHISYPPSNEWIFKLVDGIKTSQALQINVLVIEDLFVRGNLPIEFPNLHQLDITVDEIIDAQVPAIFSFLQGLPNLRKLSMVYDGSFFKDVKYPTTSLENSSEFDFASESTNLLSDHLSETEIAFAGFNPEIGMVEHLLKHARGLKKLFIYCSEPYYDVLATKIKSFETASSQVAISICYDMVYNFRSFW